MEQWHGQGHPGQLGNVVDHKVRVRSRGGDIIPILGDGVLREMEINRRNRRDGVHAQALRVGRQFHAVRGVVAGHMGDHRETSLSGLHHVLQHQLALRHALINALARGAAHINALHALFNQKTGQLLNALGADIAFFIVTRVKRRNHTLIFCYVSHDFASIVGSKLCLNPSQSLC